MGTNVQEAVLKIAYGPLEAPQPVPPVVDSLKNQILEKLPDVCGWYLAYRELWMLITIRSVPHGHRESMGRVLTHGRWLGAMRGE